MTSLQQYHAEHYGGFVEEEDIDDDNQENSPLKPFNNLQNSLLNILRPPKIPEKPQSTYLLQPELYRQEEGVPTLVHNNIFLPIRIFLILNMKYSIMINIGWISVLGIRMCPLRFSRRLYGHQILQRVDL